MEGNSEAWDAYLVHAWSGGGGRVFVAGRLSDGRSFAGSSDAPDPVVFVRSEDAVRASAILEGLRFRSEPAGVEDFDTGVPLQALRFVAGASGTARTVARREARTAAERLSAAGIASSGPPKKEAEAWVAERGIPGALRISGASRPGRWVDLVFPRAELRSARSVPILPGPDGRPIGAGIAEGQGSSSDVSGTAIPLAVASFDIETDEETRQVLAAAFSLRFFGLPGGYSAAGYAADPRSAPTVRTSGEGLGSTAGPVAAGSSIRPRSAMHILLPGSPREASAASAGEASDVPEYHADEASLLAAFFRDIRAADPDVLVGWNITDFDIPRLAERCRTLGLPFGISRSTEEARWFPGEGRRSAGVIVPGRQVMDALRMVRAGPVRYADYSLETVARSVLGEGKLVASRGEEKLAELRQLYREDPERFGRYCFRDADLVLDILERTGLFSLTLERARLTGVSLDKAWTSVASFERAYGRELRARSVAEPFPAGPVRVSGAAGGTVLPPVGGLFRNVAVFDFRSLYPTIIRTFNIDPLAHARARIRLAPSGEASGSPGGLDSAAPESRNDGDPIVAPNGAAFSRRDGVLPSMIACYFAARRAAQRAGDETAAYVFKILMNSYYGVLGTSTCRYARTELAGAITSFAKEWLGYSRDRFVERGLRVLYGDTDSLFVELPPTLVAADADFDAFASLGTSLAGEINNALAAEIRRRYGVESYLELRFEKAYRRFLIPPLRSSQGAAALGGPAAASEGAAPRGRAKGYAGLLLGPEGEEVEVKGMEAARTDSTPLARRLQMELLERIFRGEGEDELKDFLLSEARRLESGALDRELVYRKRLSRPPEAYTASTPPQVKAARALGWTGKRGVVEYVWTSSGPEPASARQSPLDRPHYLATQILPLAESLFQAAGWDVVRLRTALLGSAEGQMELGL